MATHHTLPAAQALYLAELVRRWNVTAEDLLAGSSVDPAMLHDPAARIDVPTAVGLLERARALTGEPALGYYLGLQMRLSMFGHLGFAAWSAPTVRAAIELSVKYTPIVTTAIGLRLRLEGGEASILVDECADFGTARDVVLLAVLVGMWQMGQAGTGCRLSDGFLDVGLRPPPYAAKLRAIMPSIRFGRPVTRLVFDVSRLLDLPYRTADPVALQLARDQCERQFDALGLDGRIAGRVRSIVARGEKGFSSRNEVAVSLGTSPRTLTRWLAAEGRSFSEIVDEERREAATVLLLSPNVSLEQIATRLGYSNVPNFARAFRRWTGSSPADFRSNGPAPARR